MDGVAKHAAGISRVKHIRAMSQEPEYLRFLNKIKVCITFATVILGFRTVTAEWIWAPKICQPEKNCQLKDQDAEKRTVSCLPSAHASPGLTT
jgi:hypothetical protein